jgi:hypothetical protein
MTQSLSNVQFGAQSSVTKIGAMPLSAKFDGPSSGSDAPAASKAQ